MVDSRLVKVDLEWKVVDQYLSFAEVINFKDVNKGTIDIGR